MLEVISDTLSRYPIAALVSDMFPKCHCVFEGCKPEGAASGAAMLDPAAASQPGSRCGPAAPKPARPTPPVCLSEMASGLHPACHHSSIILLVASTFVVVL